MNSEPMTLADRIRVSAERAGGGNKLSQKTGIPRSTLETYITGQSEPQVSRLIEIAKVAEVNVAWLATGEGPQFLTEESIVEDFKKTGALELPAAVVSRTPEGPEGFVLIPRLEVEASAGNGREVAQIYQPDQTVAFKESWLRRIGVSPNNAHALSAVGDSMEPTIRDGDLLLVDTSIDRVSDNGIYIVVLAGLVFVKRLHVRRDGSLVLKSDNPSYPDEDVPAADTADLHVAGRVRWFGRSI